MPTDTDRRLTLTDIEHLRAATDAGLVGWTACYTGHCTSLTVEQLAAEGMQARDQGTGSFSLEAEFAGWRFTLARQQNMFSDGAGGWAFDHWYTLDAVSQLAVRGLSSEGRTCEVAASSGPTYAPLPEFLDALKALYAAAARTGDRSSRGSRPTHNDLRATLRHTLAVAARTPTTDAAAQPRAAADQETLMGTTATLATLTPDLASDSRLRGLVALVETSMFEMHVLQGRHALTSHRPFDAAPDAPHLRVAWAEERCGGWLPCYGTLDGRSMHLSLTFARLNGALVGFWQPTSELVDHAVASAWLTANTRTPGGQPVPRFTADNFDEALDLVLRAAAAA